MHTSESNLMFLKSQFTGLKMTAKEMMSDFISCLDKLADQITSLDEEVKEVDKVVILTCGIPETYHYVVIVRFVLDVCWLWVSL